MDLLRVCISLELYIVVYLTKKAFKKIHMTESGWHGLQIVGVKYNCKGYDDDVLGAMNIISIFKKYLQIMSSKSIAERYDFLEMFVHQAHSSEHVYEFISEEQPGGGRKCRPHPGLPCFIGYLYEKVESLQHSKNQAESERVRTCQSES